MHQSGGRIVKGASHFPEEIAGVRVGSRTDFHHRSGSETEWYYRDRHHLSGMILIPIIISSDDQLK
jgi:hypothetical protein